MTENVGATNYCRGCEDRQAEIERLRAEKKSLKRRVHLLQEEVADLLGPPMEKENDHE